MCSSSTTHARTPVRHQRAHEKRRRNRVNFQRTLTVLVLTPSLQLVEVSTSDLSTGGMGFSSPVPLRMGDMLAVVFPRDGMSNLYLCRVRNVRWIKALCYRIGVEFSSSQRLYTGEESIPISWLGLKVGEAGFNGGEDCPLPRSAPV